MPKDEVSTYDLFARAESFGCFFSTVINKIPLRPKLSKNCVYNRGLSLARATSLYINERLVCTSREFF